MMHGQHWSGQDVRGWCATEKLDGCRGYWDGSRMWSRSGRAFPVPDAWRAALPDLHVEGEIWAGRGQFELSVRAVVNNSWDPRVCFIVFDAPQVEGTWPQRIARAKKTLRGNFAAAVPWQPVTDLDTLARMFRAVGEGGGEGLMLRCAETRGYQPGRSRAVLKLTRDPINGSVPPGRLVAERRVQMGHRSRGYGVGAHA